MKEGVKGMKKIFLTTLVTVFGIFVAGNAMALVYTPSLSDLDTFYEVTTGTLNGPDVSPITSGGEVGPTGNFNVTIPSGGWGDVQIGRDASIEGPGSAYYSGSWADLSAYDTYELFMTNISTTNDWFMANIYLNTGWTDAPWSETDYYYQNTWTWVAPGTTERLVLDLAAAVSVGGGGGAGHTIDNLTHVSSLGFNIGTNYGCGDYFGNELDGKATPVPEPTTLALLGLSVIGLNFRRRK